MILGYMGGIILLIVGIGWGFEPTNPFLGCTQISESDRKYRRFQLI